MTGGRSKDDAGEDTFDGGAGSPALPFRQPAMPSRPQYKTGPMRIVSADVPRSGTPFAGQGGSIPAIPAATPAVSKDRPLAIPAPHVLGARGQGAPPVATPAVSPRQLVPQTPASPMAPPPPPARVRAAPLHLDPIDWPGNVPQRAPEVVPVRDVPPPAWTQRSDWDALAASNAAVEQPPPAPPATAQGSAVPLPAPSTGGAPTEAAPSSPRLAEEESVCVPAGFVAPAMELVFHDEAFFGQIRAHFRRVIEDMEPDPNRSFGEEIAEVLHVLASAARPRDPKVVAAHSQRHVGSGALPPLEVWDGTLALELDPVERLRLELESARRVLKPSPDLARVIELVQADLDATRGLSARRALLRSKELREQSKWGLQTDEDHTLDLLERRAYRAVDVFGGRHVRGTLKVKSTVFCVYLAASAASQLPLLPAVNVTAIAERRARQEQDAVSDYALHFRALARHVV